MLLKILTAAATIPLLVSGLACYEASGAFTQAEWPICHQVTPDLVMYSGVAGPNDRFLKLGLHNDKHTKGWSALGVGGNGGMKGAHQIVVRLAGGVWVAEDRHSLDYVQPSLDEEQNVRLLFASQGSKGTEWAVLVPQDSCDGDDYKVEDKSRYMLWARAGTHSFGYHGAARGAFHANLVSGVIAEGLLEGVTPADVLMNDVQVQVAVGSSADPSNPYICSITDLEEIIPKGTHADKHHVARFAPKLNGAGSKYVHHMLLYSCTGTDFTHGDVVQDCERMPPGCNEIKWVWALGGEDVNFPADVAMPIGQGNRFMALQIHYYNPDLDVVRDSSGVELSITDTNRAIDAGLLTLNGGTGSGMRSPLAADTADIRLEPLIVPSECTETWTEPINVVGATHHMHLRGQSSEIEVSRAGVSLGLLRYERRYDFNHQAFENPSINQLQPGDQISLTCTYDTTGVESTTEFGDLTQQEMCYAPIMYYPAQAMTSAAYVKNGAVDVATKNSQAESECSTASTEVGFTTENACTGAFVSNPWKWGFGLETVPYTATQICNNALANFGYPTSDIVDNVWPDLCPACWLSMSCTDADLIAHANTVICKDFCEQFELSLYPDTSDTVSANFNVATQCGSKEVYAYVPPRGPASCTPVGGDLKSSSADSVAATALGSFEANGGQNAFVPKVLSGASTASTASACLLLAGLVAAVL